MDRAAPACGARKRLTNIRDTRRGALAVTVQSRSTAITRLPVRRLGAADLPACIELTVDRGWSAEETKWRLMLAVSEIYGVDDPAGGLAGVVGLTRYGAELAVVGMMLVASRHGRQGLGRRLMNYVLDRANGAVVYLTATDLGRGLYAQLGFRAIDTSTRYIGMFTPRAGVADYPIREVTAADLTGIAAADLAAFGADRSLVLAQVRTVADRFVECGEPVSGYAAAWPNGDTTVIGPVVADDLSMATALISRVADGCSGPLRIDVLGRHRSLAAWARRRGLQAGASTTLMVHGGALPGQRARLFAPVNIAIG